MYLCDDRLRAVQLYVKLGKRVGPTFCPARVSVCYSREVVHFFRVTGDGWQFCMDGALKEYIAQHPKASIY